MVRYLDKLGLLTEIIPEVKEMKGAKQPKEHYWDVFDHSVGFGGRKEELLV